MSLNYGMKDGKLQSYYDEDEEIYEEEDFEEEENEEEGIIYSENHGVNPSLELCMLCNESMGIIMFGKLPNDEKAPYEVCLGRVCDKCIAKLEEDEEHLFIEIDKKPTGRYAKIPDKYLVPEFVEENKNQRIFYVDSEMFDKIFNNG